MYSVFFGLVALGVSLATALAALGAGIGQGIASAAALNGIARQPEAAGRIQTTMFICLGIIEALAIYGLVISLGILRPLLPSAAQVAQMLAK